MFVYSVGDSKFQVDLSYEVAKSTKSVIAATPAFTYKVLNSNRLTLVLVRYSRWIIFSKYDKFPKYAISSGFLIHIVVGPQ